MIKIPLLFLMVFSKELLPAQTNPKTADKILNKAYRTAEVGNKNVLLIFHASWCGWCRKMDASLDDQEVKPLIDKHYVTIHLTVYESKDEKDMENPGAEDFLKKNGGADKGLPYWFILDKKGSVLANSELRQGANTGCPATKEEVTYFINVLKKTSSLNGKELEIIESRFRKNER